ncbi:MAG TPA: hypothetical protein VES67_06070 [Vicinamibacterales bacterium]|nr:hypothetical protein [Vicinamibacterales bacterium]
MSLIRRLFGPSRKEIWQKLSQEMDARYVQGGFGKGDKVEVDHGDWTVTLDTYVVSTGKSAMVFTRMRAPYANPGGFRFTVYRRSIFSGIGKFFGMQDIEIGDPQFDHDFIIQSNRESQVRELLANVKIRDLISRQKDIQFSVKDDEGWFGTKFPDGVDELHFVVVGVIKDIERLRLLYDLFAETLDHLCRIGAALETAPNVKLK